MADAILIIGGYGAVGSVIAARLARHYGDRLIIAGRNEARAARLAAELGPRVRWRVLDVAKPIDDEETFDDVRMVVMCLDLPQIELVRQCFQRGICYVDLSAEYAIFSAITSLDDLAKRLGSTALLSVGLMPGLSNLMARHSLRFVEPIARVDSAVLLGLGEKHGAAATAWTLNHLSDATGTTRISFSEPYHQRTVYRFAFPDQYTLTKTLPIECAASWLCFDSSLMTHLIGLARLPILRYLFQQNEVKQVAAKMIRRWRFGTDNFVLTTRAHGDTGTHQAWLSGKREVEVTGLVAAEVIHHMVRQQPDAGVFHIEQWFQLEDFLPLLKQHGVTFSSRIE